MNLNMIERRQINLEIFVVRFIEMLGIKRHSTRIKFYKIIAIQMCIRDRVNVSEKVLYESVRYKTEIYIYCDSTNK